MNIKRLKAFIIGKSSPEEAQQITNWIHSEDAIKEIEQELKLYQPQNVNVDSECIYNAIINQTNFKNEKYNRVDFIPDNGKKSTRRSWFGIAASVAIAFLITFFGVYKYNQNNGINGIKGLVTEQQIVKTAEKGQKLTIHLKDGTRVKLNSNSSLTYYFTGESMERKVRLTGEAFFDVARDESRPFIVETDNIEISVLGTVFNVNASLGDHIVAVKSGKVKVRSLEAEDAVFLEKDQLSRMNKRGNLSIESFNGDEDLFGWVDNKLIFQSDEFTDVTLKISAWYDYEFEVKKDISKHDKYTAVHTNPTLKEVMESLAHAYQFNFTINENKIVIE